MRYTHVVVAGIPNNYYNIFLEKAMTHTDFSEDRTEKESLITFKDDERSSLIMSPFRGQDIYSQSFLEDTFRRISQNIDLADRRATMKSEVRRSNLLHSLLLVYIDFPQMELVENSFYPFCLMKIIRSEHITRNLVPNATFARGWVNAVFNEINSTRRRFKTASILLEEEIHSRKNKTALLLPIKNFHSNRALPDLVRRISCKLLNFKSDDAARDFLRNEIQQLRKIYVSKIPHKDKELEVWTDVRKLAFKSPGKDLHGDGRDIGQGGCALTCKIGARIRLGCSIISGFHYDVSPHIAGNYPSNLQSCHEPYSVSGTPPKIDIYPNDFIR